MIPLRHRVVCRISEVSLHQLSSDFGLFIARERINAKVTIVQDNGSNKRNRPLPRRQMSVGGSCAYIRVLFLCCILNMDFLDFLLKTSSVGAQFPANGRYPCHKMTIQALP